MGVVSFIVGILASLISCVLMIPTVIPLLGWVSWLPLVIAGPLGLIGIVFAIIGLAKKDGRGKVWAWLGLILNLGSILIPVIRLIIGGGVV